jgi:hypothetical protein
MITIIYYGRQTQQCFTKPDYSGFVGLGVSTLAVGTQLRGFKPGRSRRIFQGEKILSEPSFGRENKPVGSHVVDLRHVKDL